VPHERVWRCIQSNLSLLEIFPIVYSYTHTHTQIHTCTFSASLAHIHDTHTHTLSLTHTHITPPNPSPHTHKHTHAHTFSASLAHTQTHTYTHRRDDPQARSVAHVPTRRERGTTRYAVLRGMHAYVCAWDVCVCVRCVLCYPLPTTQHTLPITHFRPPTTLPTTLHYTTPHYTTPHYTTLHHTHSPLIDDDADPELAFLQEQQLDINPVHTLVTETRPSVGFTRAKQRRCVCVSVSVCVSVCKC
jgi:hypothetical protein